MELIDCNFFVMKVFDIEDYVFYDFIVKVFGIFIVNNIFCDVIVFG